MFGLNTYSFPFPQTLGKDRDIRTVDQSTFESWPFRPTSTEAESLIRTGIYSGQNWYYSPYASQKSNKKMREESIAKAATVGNGNNGGGFASIIDIFGKAAGKFKSIADEFFYGGDPWSWTIQEQARYPGASVPGRPTSPGEIHYTSADYEYMIKQRLKEIQEAGASLLSQSKGLFNLGYPPAVQNGQQPIAGLSDKKIDMIPLIVVAFLIFVVVAK